MHDDRTELLTEMMLTAERFMTEVEARARAVIPTDEYKELTLKISQCRACLGALQEFYNNGRLSIDEPVVRGNFRSLTMMLLWAAFRARGVIDYKRFRLVVQIVAGFTYLLAEPQKD